ncbi:hypothetical protein RRF57_007952 [Xylaria bambusicola]|uniref:rRNA adenine N(6)-methyltransferase n=1 Tax=Xylaria bambusicola TaxID=326684 RepID=A0AAN7UST1_9PEZI
MGKARTSKRGNATGPYERPSKSKNNAAVNNVFKFTKDLGQHILKNPGIAQASTHSILSFPLPRRSFNSLSGTVVDKAYLKPTDVVLEVGPGTGNLTVQILNQARKVIACEMDPRMAAEVTKRVQGKPEQKRLEVILGDVIKTDLTDMNFDETSNRGKKVCISNTPYQISSPLIFKLLRLPKGRTARPGDPLYSLLTILDILVRPPPQVDSSVVRLEIKTSDRPNISFEEFDGMLRICFNRPRKILRSAFLGSKEVLKLIETNYRLWCAQNDIPIDESLVDDAGEDQDMEVDDNDNDPSNMDIDGDDNDLPSFFGAAKTTDEGAITKAKVSGKKTRLAVLVKEKVRKVLEETELAESRSAKMDENSFLRLLAAFHAEGIHFS